MATWAEFAAAEPEMAALGLRQLQKFGLAYLGTTRRDGSPRVNPVCPVIADGRVFVATAPSSPKRLDLLRDGRYVLHMLPGKQEEEFWVRGRAKRVTDPASRAQVVETATQRGESDGGPLRIKPEEWLFEYDIDEAGTTVWADFGTPDHRPCGASGGRPIANRADILSPLCPAVARTPSCSAPSCASRSCARRSPTTTTATTS